MIFVFSVLARFGFLGQVVFCGFFCAFEGFLLFGVWIFSFFRENKGLQTACPLGYNSLSASPLLPEAQREVKVKILANNKFTQGQSTLCSNANNPSFFSKDLIKIVGIDLNSTIFTGQHTVERKLGALFAH